MRAPDTSPPKVPAPQRRAHWAPMPFIALGVSLIIMDATIVNVAIPTIIGSLSLDASGAEWINSVYPLAFASLLILLGRLGDRHGRRRLLLAGLTVFGVASLVAATAPTGGILILGRLAQGVGGAMILPATLATVNAIYTGRDRAIAFAIWGSTIGGMAAVGPLVGGWLTTDFSWRWAFLINLPIIAIVILGTLRVVPETTDPDQRAGTDLTASLASVLGLGSLVFALVEGESFGWWRTEEGASFGSWQWPFAISPIPMALFLALVSITTLVLVELARQRAGKVVLLDLSLFRIPSFRCGSIAALIVALGEFGLLFALPLFLQGALGYSALDTGWLMLVLAIGTFLVSGATPPLTRRLGGRIVVIMGLGLEAAAVAGLGLSIDPQVQARTLGAWLFLYGMGVGLATAQLTSVILSDVPAAQGGQASGMQSTVRQVGSALGIAVLGTMLVVVLGGDTSDRLSDLAGLPAPERDAIVAMVRESAGSAIPTLRSATGGEAVADAATQALVHAARTVSLVASGILVLGLLATLALPRSGRDALRDGG